MLVWNLLHPRSLAARYRASTATTRSLVASSSLNRAQNPLFAPAVTQETTPPRAISSPPSKYSFSPTSRPGFGGRSARTWTASGLIAVEVVCRMAPLAT